ncbi:MAG: isopentenyl-diphosphate delta-isomerase [Cellvibrionaceae bacterium]|jgi:isopentenyl-diphosphate delta-isomerase
MTEQSPQIDSASIDQRKADHIRINLEEDVSFNQLTTGLEKFFFMHQALPELDLDQIKVGSQIFGRKLKTPLLISSMTGGTGRAATINRVLAEAAQAAGMAIGLGSQRAAIEDDKLAESYCIRDYAPDVPIFANVGAAQLNLGYGVAQMQKAIDMCEADALILHLNPLQEAVQPEGDRNWRSILPKIEALCRELPVPVIAKEVGWGISENVAKMLVDAGISAIDVAGSGGTSWSQVEMYRAQNWHDRRIAATFRNWGIPTTQSIIYCRQAAPSADFPIFASGGIKNGIDAAKCIALGANLVGLAGEFLKVAVEGGTRATVELADIITEELKISMFCAGAADLQALSKTTLHSS